MKIRINIHMLIGCLIGLLLQSLLFKLILNSIFEHKHIYNNEEKLNLFTENKDQFYKNSHEQFDVHGNGKIVVKLLKNDNLSTALLRNGFDQKNIYEIISILQKNINVKVFEEKKTFAVKYSYKTLLNEINGKSNLKPVFKKKFEKRTITELVFKKKEIKYIIEQNQNGYVLHIEKQKLVVDTHIVKGVIKNNLFTDAIVNNIKATTLFNALNEYAFLIDFQRDIHKNDKFIFVLETTKDVENQFIAEKVLYANLILNGHNNEIFNFHDKFYDRKGKSIQKKLLKTPVDGARITSNFTTKRKHPILGYTRAHKGIDMAVPTGTPIYSAGDGVVVEIQRNHPGYGKFVLIRHNNEYSTKYAHMSRIANIKVGQKIKQRQTIGYVGMTGLATGPHLHYEVIRYGKHINPRDIKVVEIKQISQSKMPEFKKITSNIDNILSRK